MGTVMYWCGCAISTWMYGERDVMWVHHCRYHRHLYSQDKTLRQMAEEIRTAARTWNPLAMAHEMALMGMYDG